MLSIGICLEFRLLATRIMFVSFPLIFRIRIRMHFCIGKQSTSNSFYISLHIHALDFRIAISFLSVWKYSLQFSCCELWVARFTVTIITETLLHIRIRIWRDIDYKKSFCSSECFWNSHMKWYDASFNMRRPSFKLYSWSCVVLKKNYLSRSSGIGFATKKNKVKSLSLFKKKKIVWTFVTKIPQLLYYSGKEPNVIHIFGHKFRSSPVGIPDQVDYWFVMMSYDEFYCCIVGKSWTVHLHEWCSYIAYPYPHELFLFFGKIWQGSTMYFFNRATTYVFRCVPWGIIPDVF